MVSMGVEEGVGIATKRCDSQESRTGQAGIIPIAATATGLILI